MAIGTKDALEQMKRNIFVTFVTKCRLSKYKMLPNFYFWCDYTCKASLFFKSRGSQKNPRFCLPYFCSKTNFSLNFSTYNNSPHSFFKFIFVPVRPQTGFIHSYIAHAVINEITVPVCLGFNVSQNWKSYFCWSFKVLNFKNSEKVMAHEMQLSHILTKNHHCRRTTDVNNFGKSTIIVVSPFHNDQ